MDQFISLISQRTLDTDLPKNSRGEKTTPPKCECTKKAYGMANGWKRCKVVFSLLYSLLSVDDSVGLEERAFLLASQ